MATGLRESLFKLVKKWEEGEITEGDVLNQSEDIWDSTREWPTLPESDPRSIAIEVLDHLSSLNWQLVCAEDIPEILRFLQTPLHEEVEGWRRWKEYWDNIDYPSRAKELKDNDLYMTGRLLR